MKIQLKVVFLVLYVSFLEARTIVNETVATYIKHKRNYDPNNSKGQRYLNHMPQKAMLKPLFNTQPQEHCRRPATCQPLTNNTCMGVKLPYHSTTLELVDLSSQERVQEKLQQYQYLKYIPECWAVIQPFLCALYMPKCENGSAYLPSREMCRFTLAPCHIFFNSSQNIFPDFLNYCQDDLFPPNCANDLLELKYNRTSYCLEPLVKTDKVDWYYEGVDGCGLSCRDSLYTANEHNQIHKLIAYCVLICLAFNAFTVITFIIDWKTANKYPALAIFYVNICFFISYIGWLVQFLGNDTREDVVCNKDGTLRKSEPSASENLSCVIVFVLVYYFLIAGMVWFVIFSYAWYMSSLQALGKIQERVDKKRAYFHLVAWSLPLILTITTMAIGEIDGDYVTGICFVGFVNIYARVGLLLAPLIAVMASSGYVVTKGLILLIKVKIDSREIISDHSSRKIRSNIVRMSVFTIFMIVFCVITFGYHNYWSMNKHLWQKSLRNYITCKLTALSTDFSHCKQESRPSVAMLQLQLLSVFGAGIAMASWVWCDATFHVWGRYIRKKFNCEVEEPMKLQKHKIIAQAFAKRQKFNAGGRISIQCQNHTDPVGLQFELNSAASNELSTTWAANLPQFINRRGAVPNETAYSSSMNPSVDSEVSLSVRHVSIESRRNSGDSQMSVKIAEIKATRKVKSRGRNRRNKHMFRKNSRAFSNSRKIKRESSTSLDSHMQILNMLTQNSQHKIAPNLDRRTANAGLEELLNGVEFSSHNYSDEDRDVSVTMSEKCMNLKVNPNNFDLNDLFTMQSLKQAKIEELHSNSSSSSDSEEEQAERQALMPPTQSTGRASSHASSRRSNRSKRSRRSRIKYSSNSNSENGVDSSSPEKD